MHTQIPNSAFAPAQYREAPFVPVHSSGDHSRPTQEHQADAMPPDQPVDERQEETKIVAQVQLSRPALLPDGSIVEVIKFREPTFRDFMDCTDFAQFKRSDGETQTPFDADAIEKWFDCLTGLPPSIFSKITIQDGTRILLTISSIMTEANVGNSEASLPTFGSVAG